MTDAKMEAIMAFKVFVEDRVNELVELDDDPEFLNETLNDFLAQVDTGMEEIEKFRKDKQFKELGEKAHFLKGSSLALGCEQLGHIFETLQHLKTPTDEEIVLIDRCIEQALKTWEETRPYLEEYIIEEGDEDEEEDEEGS